MFSLTRQPIVPPVLASPGAGGFVTFDGKVRNTHQDRPVTGLEYEAFDELVLAEGTRLMTEAVAHYGLLEARCIHRVGGSKSARPPSGSASPRRIGARRSRPANGFWIN